MALLISVDLIIHGKYGYLLGMRNNNLAKESWFVPGGRIFKNETIKQVGVEININNVDFLGVFEHFYDNSLVSSKISIHYVVIVFQVSLELDIKELQLSDHSKYRYFNKGEINNSPDVYKYTKSYFLD